MPADIYQAQAPDANLTPLPPSEAPTEGFQAMQQTAAAGDNLAFRLQRARDATLETEASTQLALRSAEIYNPQKVATDKDFSTMPARYAQEWQEASGDILNTVRGQVSAETYARIAHQATIHGITGANSVGQSAFMTERSGNLANWQTAGAAFSDQFVNAKSDAERAVASQMAEQYVTRLRDGGWIQPADAQTQIDQWKTAAQKAYVAKIQMTDPARAKAMLADPSNPFVSDISPGDRIAMQEGAQRAVDETGHLKFDVLAKTNPAAAAAAAVRIAPGDTVVAGDVFEKGVIWQESRGDPTAISPAGAIGLAQIMPGTARQMAREVGRADLAGMPDAQLTETLVRNPALNKQLGQRYWLQQVDHEGGYLPGAMAAYNAGPKNADRWMKIASDKFGNDPTPQQFMSVVDIKETRDYIAAIYGHLGAPVDAYGLSGNGVLRAQSQVLTAANEQQRQFVELQNKAAASAWKTAWKDEEPLVQYMRDGYPIDPTGWANTKTQVSTAAAAGNADAAQKLDLMNRTEQLAPFVKQAWQMPPPQVQAAADDLETKMRSGEIPTTQPNIDRLDALNRIATQTQGLRKTDPVTLGERQGLYRPVDLPLDQPGSPQFASALATRAAQAAQSADQNKADVLPLKPYEAEQIRTQWGQMDPQAQLGFLASARNALPDPRQFQAFVGQFAANSPTTLQMGRIVSMGGDKEFLADAAWALSQKSDGARLQRPKTEAITESASRIIGAAARDIPEFAEDAKMLASAGLAAAIVREGYDPALMSPRVIDQAVQKASGATYQDGVQFGGWQDLGRSRVLAPPDVRAGSLKPLLNMLVDKDLQTDADRPVAADKQPIPVDRLRGGTFVSRGPGVYAIALGDPASANPKWVKSPDGSNYLLDLNALAPALRQRLPQAYK